MMLCVSLCSLAWSFESLYHANHTTQAASQGSVQGSGPHSAHSTKQTHAQRILAQRRAVHSARTPQRSAHPAVRTSASHDGTRVAPPVSVRSNGTRVTQSPYLRYRQALKGVSTRYTQAHAGAKPPPRTAAEAAAFARCLDSSRPALLTSGELGRGFNLTSCAVVGAAPELAFLNLAAHIDAHGTVIRLNGHKPTPLTGNRTDMRVSNNFPQLHDLEDAALRVLPAKDGTCAVVAKKPLPGVEVVSKSVVAGLSKEARIRNKTIPSTGALGVYIALQMCRSLTIFGFSGMSTYDHVTMDEHHDWEAEIKWIDGLARAGRLRSVNARTLHGQLCARIAQEATANNTRRAALAGFAC